MLTIQPKLTNASNARPIAFRSNEAVYSEADEGSLRDKADFYEKKVREFDETIGDSKAPKFLKKMAKGFRVISEALFEGWLVAWGATKGSNVMKSAVVTGLNSRVATRAKSFVSPLGKMFKEGMAFVGEKLSNIRNLKSVVSFVNSVNSKIERLDKTSVGHYIVEAGRFVKSGFNRVAKSFENFGNRVKAMNVEQAYDKVAKTTSTTLGVGAGIAGAYNSATNAEERKAEQEKEANSKVIDNDVENFDDYETIDDDEKDIA
jgi:hypothetical protein